MSDKPTMTFEEFGRDGNIFFIAGAVRRAYKRAGRVDEFDPIGESMRAAGSYGEALMILSDAVEFIDEPSEVDDDDSF